MRVHGHTMTDKAVCGNKAKLNECVSTGARWQSMTCVCVCVCVCEKGKLERVCVHGHTMTVDAMRASLCPRVHNDSQGHVCEKHDKLDRVCVPPPHTHTERQSMSWVWKCTSLNEFECKWCKARFHSHHCGPGVLLPAKDMIRQKRWTKNTCKTKKSGRTSVDRSTRATLSTYNTWIHLSRLQKIYHFRC